MDGQRRLQYDNFLRDLHAVCRRAGVAVDAFHSLRKSCITNWLEGRVPPHEVQARAGHASIETTMKYYAKVDKTAMVRTRDVSKHYSPAIVA